MHPAKLHIMAHNLGLPNMRKFLVYAQHEFSSRRIKSVIEAASEDDALRIAARQLFDHHYYVAQITAA